tara:strand:- start:50 stop:769 length:720 start_codon:yes stop_codon:yes gene_type:complete
MKKTKKIKFFIGIFYLTIVGLFLYFFFSKFSLQEITSYNFIKDNRDFFFEFKKSNLTLLIFTFLIFVIIWVLAAGFISPIAIFAGFIFGKWLGSILVIFGMAIGATGLYVFANFFLKDFIRDRFLNKFRGLELKFKKSEFIYLLIYRFVGGIPFAVSNVLPCIFNVKKLNFFWATLIGVTPQIFLVCALGSGVEKIIDKNLKAPTFNQLISSPDVYIPLVVFVFLVFLTIILRKFFYKK